MKVRTAERSDSILETAAGLFEEVGYAGASMNELAKRLGGSKTTLYSYFQSKEALFDAVVRKFATSHLSEAVSELQGAADTGASLQATLTRFAERVLEVLTNDARAIACYRMVLSEAGRSDVGKLFHDAGPTECIAALDKMLHTAMKVGLIRKLDSHVCALQLLALVTAETDNRLFERHPRAIGRVAIRQMAKRAVDMFLAGASRTVS